MVLFVALSSLADGYLNYAYPVTYWMEENPIAAMILRKSGNDVGLLLSLKAAGTALVCLILVGIYHISRRHALVIASGVAAAQALILTYILTA